MITVSFIRKYNIILFENILRYSNQVLSQKKLLTNRYYDYYYDCLNASKSVFCGSFSKKLSLNICHDNSYLWTSY